MKCRVCDSPKIYRSRRTGVKEGIFLRLTFRAPYRCHDCGARYAVFGSGHKQHRDGRKHGLAEYIGLRGREHKLRQWAITVVVTAIILVLSIMFVLRMASS
jgi:hypothetical protein